MPVLIRGTFVESNGDRRMLQAILPEEAMVRTLRGAFASQLPQDARERTLAIAYKGAELADTALLAEADLLPTAERQIPHVYLCYGGTPAAPTPSVDSTPNNAPQNTLRRRRGEEMPDETHVVAQRERERERERAAPQPQPQRQPQERALPEAVDVNKCCRLCFDAEETLATGLLFSPCKCAGSMRYIHVSCLNTWRMRSQKESSYFECDQCRYKYNIVRTQWAGVVLHPHLAVAVAVVVLVLSTLLVGNLVHSTPLLESVHEKVWNFLQFYPIPFFATKYCQNDTCNTVCNTFDLWNWVERCRQAGCSCSMSPSVALSWFFAALTNGMVLVAMLGMYLNRHIILRNYFYALILLVCLYDSPAGYGRFIVVIGLVHSYYILHASVRMKAKSVMTRWGETILSVRQDTG